jgi:hypothetical protein
VSPRRRTILLCALALLGAAAGAAYAQSSGYPSRWGDVHMDREINATDALAVLNHAVGRPLPYGYYPRPNGDADGNGEVTAADALLILAYSVGQEVPGSRVGTPLTLPEPTLRLVSINGQAVAPGAEVAVADSFYVTADVTVPAGADSLRSTGLYSLRDGGEPMLLASASYQGVAPGAQRRVTLRGRLAAPGQYRVYLAARRYRPGPSDYILGDTARVAVTNADVTPPVVRITSPAAGTVVGGRQAVLMVTYTVSDNGRLYEVGAGSGGSGGGFTSADGMESGSWVRYVGLEQGNNVIRATARDLALNRGADSIVVRYDSLAPPLPATQVEVLAVNGVPLAAGATHSLADSVSVTVRVEAGPQDTLVGLGMLRWEGPTGSPVGWRSVRVLPGMREEFTFRSHFNPPGGAEIEVYAAARNPDRGWYAPRLSVQLTQSDVTPPTATVRSPADGATVAGDTVTMVVEAMDANGLFGYDAYLNGRNVYSTYYVSAPNTLAMYVQRFPSSEAGTGVLVRGANELKMVVRDRAGNETTRTVTVHKP